MSKNKTYLNPAKTFNKVVFPAPVDFFKKDKEKKLNQIYSYILENYKKNNLRTKNKNIHKEAYFKLN